MIILGISAISVRPGNNSYKYEDGFTMMQYLCMLMLHPQNKYRNSLFIHSNLINSYFDNLNIDENIEKLNDCNDDNVDEIVGDDIDANLYIPRDENTEV